MTSVDHPAASGGIGVVTMVAADVVRILLIVLIAAGWTVLPLPGGTSPAGPVWASAVDDAADADHIIAPSAYAPGTISRAPEAGQPGLLLVGGLPPMARGVIVAHPSAPSFPRAPPRVGPTGCR